VVPDTPQPFFSLLLPFALGWGGGVGAGGRGAGGG